MKIPKKIRVLGQNIQVDYVKCAQGHDSTGSYNAYYNQINLHPFEEGLSEEMQAETFLHEIFEAINNKLELRLEHPTLTALSAALFHIIRDNNLKFEDNSTHEINPDSYVFHSFDLGMRDAGAKAASGREFENPKRCTDRDDDRA